MFSCRALILIAILIAGIYSGRAAAEQVPPTTYPQFEPEESELLFVVAKRVRAGHIERAAKPGTVYMNPPPFWTELNISELIYGNGVKSRQSIYALTVSHYGRPDLSDVASRETEFLFPLWKVEGQYILPKYGAVPVIRNKAGNAFVILNSSTGGNLSCAYRAARTDFVSADFGQDFSVDKNEEYAARNMRQRPDLYRVVDGRILPRHVISMLEFKKELARFRPQGDELNCADIVGAGKIETARRKSQSSPWVTGADHCDVRFSVNRLGNARSIRFVRRPSASRLQERCARTVKQSTFPLRWRDDQTVAYPSGLRIDYFPNDHTTVVTPRSWRDGTTVISDQCFKPNPADKKCVHVLTIDKGLISGLYSEVRASDRAALRQIILINHGQLVSKGHTQGAVYMPDLLRPSIEVGKPADLVILSHSKSVLARIEGGRVSYFAPWSPPLYPE